MSFDIPLVIGHRGAAAVAPENTCVSIRRAAAAGVAMVEVDAKLTADGELVLLHDDTLDRTTDGKGAAAGVSLAGYAGLDAGRWFGDAFAGESVPTLREAVACCLDLGLGLDVEIKPNPGQDAETARAVGALLQEVWPAGRPRPWLTSFSTTSLAVCRDEYSAFPRGYLIWERPSDWADNVASLDVAMIGLGPEADDPNLLAATIALGRPVLAYTINDPTRARALWSAGVRGVFTDEPTPMLAAAAEWDQGRRVSDHT